MKPPPLAILSASTAQVIMSSPQSLLASARSAYRSALRASASTFSGDRALQNGGRVTCVSPLQGAHHVASAFRLKIRNEVLPYSASIDPTQFNEKVTLVREIADVLRKNVVQARKVDEEKERWRACSPYPHCTLILRKRRGEHHERY